MALKGLVLESSEMAPKGHVFESSEMALKGHVLESLEMAPKGHVLESSVMAPKLGLLGVQRTSLRQPRQLSFQQARSQLKLVELGLANGPELSKCPKPHARKVSSWTRSCSVQRCCFATWGMSLLRESFFLKNSSVPSSLGRKS